MVTQKLSIAVPSQFTQPTDAAGVEDLADGLAVIPYIQMITEPVKRVLRSNHNVKVAQKPFRTIGQVFSKPKDPVVTE